jgi:phosphoserine phosphatase RsbU/P
VPLQDSVLAVLRNELVAIMSGAIFVFIGLASCLLAAVRRRSGGRIFFWLGIWSAMYGVRLLTESPTVVPALWHWIQVSVPLLNVVITYLLLPVASLAWLELSAGRMRTFLCAVTVAGLIVGLAGIGFFIATGVRDKFIVHNDLISATGLVVLVIIVVVPGYSRRFLILPNRAVVVVGTLVFAVEALYFNLSSLLHYQTTRVTGSLGLAVLLFSLGYVAVQIALGSERRLQSIENELAIAREIQASILPGSNPEVKNLRVAAAYRPMTDVAGDFYEFIVVDANRIGFLVADVTGHGVPAALIAAMIKVAMQSLTVSAHDPQEVLRGLNRILSGQVHARLVSAAYLWIDTVDRVAHYSAAGHPPLLRWREGNLERVESNGLLLGVLPDSDYPLYEMSIASGDRFLLYTDGVVEPENAHGEPFGEFQFERVVRDHRQHAPAELLDRVLSEVLHWQPAPKAQHDDITLIVIDVV